MVMNRYRVARSVAVGVLVAFAVTACGGSDESDGSDAQSAASTPSSTSAESGTPDPTGGSTSGGATTTGGATFETTVTPASGVEEGATLTAKSRGADANTDYYCVLSAVTDDGRLTASDTSTLKVATADADGNLTCELTYQPFEAADENGDMRACPPTAEDAADGFRCVVALADKATLGTLSASVGYFELATN
jgi:hypothetical protein